MKNSSQFIKKEDPTPFLGALNNRPPLCKLCGADHEPEYPHEDTDQFRQYIFRKLGRAATYYDLLAHTTGGMREKMMVAMLQQMEVR